VSKERALYKNGHHDSKSEPPLCAFTHLGKNNAINLKLVVLENKNSFPLYSREDYMHYVCKESNDDYETTITR